MTFLACPTKRSFVISTYTATIIPTMILKIVFTTLTTPVVSCVIRSVPLSRICSLSHVSSAANPSSARLSICPSSSLLLTSRCTQEIRASILSPIVSTNSWILTTNCGTKSMTKTKISVRKIAMAVATARLRIRRRRFFSRPFFTNSFFV